PETPGHVGWRELHAADGAAAFKFYSEFFGWTKGDALDMGPMGVYQTFFAGDEPTGGMMTRMPQSPTPFWLFYFNVAALDAAIERGHAAALRIEQVERDVRRSRELELHVDRSMRGIGPRTSQRETRSGRRDLDRGSEDTRHAPVGDEQPVPVVPAWLDAMIDL